MEIFKTIIFLLKFIFLGGIQGFTEPLPISSSGHVVIFRYLLNIEISGLSFEIIVNFGSLLAILFIYRMDLIRILHNSFSFIWNRSKENKLDFNYFLYLILATGVTGTIGLLLEESINQFLSGIKTVGISLLFTGIALWMIKDLKGRKKDYDITLKDACIIGLAQAVALIPGISRSGATIVAGMLLGFKRETALRFSFLLYIPVSLGISLLSLPRILTDTSIQWLEIPYTLAWMAAIISTYYALKWFIQIMKKGHLKYFSYYCFLVSILILIFFK